MQLREYQTDHIYNPIVDVINQNLQTSKRNPKYSVLALSTSAGKTFTVTNFCVQYCLDNGCDVILTSPNGASLEEVKDEMVVRYPDAYIIIETGFAGAEHFVAPVTDKRVIILCHPTFLSQQNFAISKWAKKRKLVLFSDEAHKGFMCSNAEDTFEAFGYSISEYTAEWHQCLYAIPHVAWFLLSATPLRTTFSGNEFAHISEYFDKDVLCAEQAAVKNVTVYSPYFPGFSPEMLVEEFRHHVDPYEDPFPIYKRISEYIRYTLVHMDGALDKLNNKWSDEDAWLEKVTQEYKLPVAKPARAVQANNQWHARNLYRSLAENTSINTGADKKVFGYNRNDYLRNFPHYIRSQDMINHVNNKSNSTNVMVANKLIGEAVNIPNLNSMVSFHERNSVQDNAVTHSVEQLLGRMIRWPDVDGIKNWKDAIAYAENRIAQGVPREVMYKWISTVFEYEVHMSFSENNLYGILAFFQRHTYNPQEWADYKSRLIYECIAEQKKRVKVYGVTAKTAHAQAGSQNYKNYKHSHPECEHCAKREILGQTVPTCKIPVVYGEWTEDEYFASLDVHHIEGREDSATMNDADKLITVCKPMHHRLDAELRTQKKFAAVIAA
ncbi:DEAD/DEAH box helicase family protein [bacterium]|nr:DEAD/DEAH box helicase family protein [bacterium]